MEYLLSRSLKIRRNQKQEVPFFQKIDGIL